MPNRDQSLREGAIIASEWHGPREEGGYYWQALEAVAKHYKIDLDAPVRDIPQDKLDLILYGTGSEKSRSITATRMVAPPPGSFHLKGWWATCSAALTRPARRLYASASPNS
jgi:excinuclease UvrABC ATPase subunit